ncbi:MAG TPA: diacylglycerol kinase family protein [Candidatus Saccharimonadales bacterium]|nr:diacylglycerol kinase family protein [Candidatus Saccharimonadales bacterium]
MILVVHNANSGTQNSLQEIKDTMAAHGLEASYVAITDNSLKRKATEAARKGATLVAAGGDGTVSAVAGIAAHTGATLGVIPAGTLNHFAKELAITDLKQAVAALKSKKTATVDIATVNDKSFINNSSIGWYPRSLHARDELEAKVGKWPAALYGALRAALRPRRYHVELLVDGQKHTYRTPFVFIGNNAYQRTPAELGKRDSLQSGQLAIYVVKAQSVLGILRMLGHALFTRKHRTQDFAIYHATECVIHTRHHRQLSVATDGEIQRLKTPLRYRSKPKALRVIVP